MVGLIAVLVTIGSKAENKEMLHDCWRGEMLIDNWLYMAEIIHAYESQREHERSLSS